MKRWHGMRVFDKQEDYPDPKKGDVAILVCAPAGKTNFKDNIYTSCAECGKAIMHRPHHPTPCTTLCGPCAFKGAEKAKAEGEEIEVSVTSKTIKEVETWRKNRKW